MPEFFTQDFYTSRRNYNDGSTRIGQLDRLWYDSDTNSIRIGDGVTPGGRIVGGGAGGGASDFRSLLDTPSSYLGSAGQFLRVRTTENGLEFAAIEVFDGNYNSLTNRPDLSVYQLAANSFDGDYANLTNTPVIPSTLSQLTDITVSAPLDFEVLLYNSSVGVFENRSLNLTGGLENQVLVKKSSAPLDYVWEDMIINLNDSVYTRLLDQVTAQTLYIGEADPESLEANPVWRIQRVTFDQFGAVLEVRFAEGGLFNQIWNNRLALIYV